MYRKAILLASLSNWAECWVFSASCVSSWRNLSSSSPFLFVCTVSCDLVSLRACSRVCTWAAFLSERDRLCCNNCSSSTILVELCFMSLWTSRIVEFSSFIWVVLCSRSSRAAFSFLWSSFVSSSAVARSRSISCSNMATWCWRWEWASSSSRMRPWACWSKFWRSVKDRSSWTTCSPRCFRSARACWIIFSSLLICWNQT